MYDASQKAVTKLRREYSDLIHEYDECVKRDDIFEIKRKILKRIRAIEQDIILLGDVEEDFQKRFGNLLIASCEFKPFFSTDQNTEPLFLGAFLFIFLIIQTHFTYIIHLSQF